MIEKKILLIFSRGKSKASGKGREVVRRTS